MANKLRWFPFALTLIPSLVLCPTSWAEPSDGHSKDLERLWEGLAAEDTKEAQGAVLRFAAAGNQAVAFLRKRLEPVLSPGPGRTKQLIMNLDHEEYSVREAASEELSMLGRSVEPTLRRALKADPPPETRYRIGKLLNACKSLFPAGPGETRMQRAIYALDLIRSEEACQLLDSLAHVRWRGRTAAEVAVGLSEQAERQVPDLLDRLSSKDPRVRLELLEELVVETFAAIDFTYSFRYHLPASDYSLIFRRALPGLARELRDKRSKEKLLHTVSYVAYHHKLEGVAEALLEFLHDDSATARGQTLEILGVLEAGEACQEISLLLDDPEQFVRHRALRTLVHLRSPLAAPRLISNLRPEKADQHCQALQDLVRVKAVQAVPDIEPLLHDPNHNTQGWAIRALFQFNARGSRDKIFEVHIADRPAEKVHPYAVAVLVRWEDPRAIPLAMAWLKRNDGSYCSIMSDHLVEVGAKAIENPLIAFLQEPIEKGTSANAYHHTMMLLRRLRSKKAVPVLRKYVAGEHEYLACCAARELGRLGAREAVPELLALLDRRDLPSKYWYSYWSAATEALARIGDPATVGKVVAALKTKQPPNAHHVTVLNLLSAASHPETYRKLETMEMGLLSSLPIEEYLEQVTAKTSVSIALGEQARAQRGPRIVAGRKGETGLVAVENAIQMLNYSACNYTMFIEDGVVRLVTIEEAYEFWEEWLAAQKEPPAAGKESAMPPARSPTARLARQG